MDSHESFIGIDAFRRAQPRPLLLPEPVQSAPTINVCIEDRQHSPEAEYGRRIGYQFPWGQIHEGHLDADRDAGSEGAVIEWNFVLSTLHAEFLWSGGTLAELSDVCLDLLERIQAQAREENTNEGLPPFLSFSEGDALSAFAITVSGSENLHTARTWVAEVFVPGILPLIVAYARDSNIKARPADHS